MTLPGGRLGGYYVYPWGQMPQTQHGFPAVNPLKNLPFSCHIADSDLLQGFFTWAMDLKPPVCLQDDVNRQIMRRRRRCLPPVIIGDDDGLLAEGVGSGEQEGKGSQKDPLAEDTGPHP